MKTYQFDVVLNGLAVITDAQADALYAAGCDDGTPASCDGLAWVHFDRAAPSLENAIHSAVKQIEAANLAVAHVKIASDVAAALAT